MIKTFMVGAIQTNCYVFFDEISKETMIVDPGYFEARICDFIDEQQLKPKCIYLTHCHFDHILGVKELKERYNIPVYASASEEMNLMNDAVNLSTYMAGECVKVHCDKVFFDNDEFEIGSTCFRVLETPGHTAGSSCLYADKMLFSGDTMFRDTYGRCDLPTGNEKQIVQSIKTKLLTLHGDTVVYPGHGETTTIAEFAELEL